MNTKYTAAQLDVMIRNAKLNLRVVTRQLGRDDVTTTSARNELRKLMAARKACRE